MRETRWDSSCGCEKLRTFVKQAAEGPPSCWAQQALQVGPSSTPDGWAASPGDVANCELRARSLLWGPTTSVRQIGDKAFTAPRSSSLAACGKSFRASSRARLLVLTSGGQRSSPLHENSRFWQQQLKELLYLQLPKDGATQVGQGRPIGLLPMIYRL
eukprot:1894684-Amphidinium_carterae.1